MTTLTDFTHDRRPFLTEAQSNAKYYFKIEKPSEKSPLIFAYIWEKGDDDATSPPVKEFHSLRGGNEARQRVAKKAVKWINEHGAIGAQQ